MKVMIAALAMSAGAWFSSCSATHNQQYLQEPEASLDALRGVAVVTPEDGRYETKVYPGSGAKTSAAVTEAFRAQGIEAQEIAVPAGENARDAARNVGAGYVAIPLLKNWEDRATEWSSKPDRTNWTLSLYDVDVPDPLVVVEFWSHSKWATFGGDHPEDLLAKPLEAFVAKLYGREPPEKDAASASRGGREAWKN